MIEASGPGLLVVAEGYLAGWRAEIDGRPAAIQPADLAYLGLARANFELENQGNARRAFERVAELDPDLAARFSHLVSGGADGTRASAAVAPDVFVWAGEQE